jgi:UDP-N-acetylmuramyl pentapeptide phosphotransferase/UDP-N-acetylglucosamine-1-phosphate transferase
MNLIQFFLIFFLGVLINFFVIYNYKFLKLSIFLDKEFNKPQSFHKKAILCFGGVSIYFLFILFFILSNKSEIVINFLYITTPIFFVGLMDDLKFRIKPSIRLLLLFFFILFSVKILNISILNTNIGFFDNFLKNYIFSSFIFVALCFIFIINGSNFIDGFNGLLAIHSLIILIIINFINFYFKNYEILMLGLIIFFSILSFFIFNFPKAKIFLGDSGSYLVGASLAYIVIQTSNILKEIPSFFFACLFYYLFFEVFFSFFRKLLYEKINPLIPDRKHLHMLFYYKYNKYNPDLKSNFMTSFYINLVYFFSIFPLFFFYKNFFISKVYFFILLFIYLFCYYFLLKNNKATKSI